MAVSPSLSLEDEVAEEDGVDTEEEIMTNAIEIVTGSATADVRGALVTGIEMAMDPDAEVGLIMTTIVETEVAMPPLPERTGIKVAGARVEAADTAKQALLQYLHPTMTVWNKQRRYSNCLPLLSNPRPQQLRRLLLLLPRRLISRHQIHTHILRPQLCLPSLLRDTQLRLLDIPSTPHLLKHLLLKHQQISRTQQPPLQASLRVC